MEERNSLFPKQIKIDDYQSTNQNNVLRVMETSNLLLGSGGRTTNASIILAKALHFQHEEGIINLNKKHVLELGSGVGMLGIYLACLGARVILSDLPMLKQMLQKNISFNKKIINGSAECKIINWKHFNHQEQKIANLQLVKDIDLTIVCECGGLDDFVQQIKWIGKQGMILCFIERQHETSQQYINSRQLQKYLLTNQYQYQKIQNVHPDYIDERVNIYKIWK